MKLNIPKLRFVSTALVLILLSIGAFAQKNLPEKTSSVAGYILEKDDSGLVRKRIVKTENIKVIPSAIPSAEKILELEKSLFALINAKRSEIGLPTLFWSDDVARIARLHSENMAKFSFFSHRGLDGKMVDDRADQLGITKWKAMGENIAYNRGFRDPIATVVEKWMESQGHRENLLSNRWKDSAIGIAVTGDGTYYFTQVFMVKR